MFYIHRKSVYEWLSFFLMAEERIYCFFSVIEQVPAAFLMGFSKRNIPENTAPVLQKI